MILAKENGGLIQAKPGKRAICPACMEEVIAKCGEINAWHWSHKNDTECDSWSEPETIWHYNWKTLFPLDSIEVVKGNHRADVEWMGRVIEFQHSNISSEEIQEREFFYNNMIWVVDASSFSENFVWYHDAKYIRWKWLRKSWFYAKKPLFFQIDNKEVLLVCKFTAKGFYYKSIGINAFKKEYLNLRLTSQPTPDIYEVQL